MHTTATLAALNRIDAAPVPASPPLAIVEGEPRTDLGVIELRCDGPADRRSAQLSHRGARIDLGSRVDILQPVNLAGGGARLVPLLRGRILVGICGGGEQLLAVEDDWSALLETAPAVARPFTAASTLREAIAALPALDLRTDLVEPIHLDAPVAVEPRAGQTHGDLLDAMLDRAGLFVQRELRWRGHAVVERRRLRSRGRGRPIRIPLTQTANPAALIESVRGRHAPASPVRLIAEARGQVVESTFTLAPGWGEAPLDLDDNEYTRSASADFDAVAGVFRFWVLDEDVTALFGEGVAIGSRGMRFEPCLTRDPAGRSVGIVVERSIDSGETWLQHGGPVVIATDRPAVVLDDDALPGDWLAAVRAGTGRVRVTASLRSPNPLHATRWIGNAFFGPFVERRLAVGDAFALRRVSSGSRFAGGGRDADVRDDRDAMTGWLAGYAENVVSERVTIELLTTAPAIRIGDRIEVAGCFGRVVGIRRRLERNTAELVCDTGRSSFAFSQS